MRRPLILLIAFALAITACGDGAGWVHPKYGHRVVAGREAEEAAGRAADLSPALPHPPRRQYDLPPPNRPPPQPPNLRSTPGRRRSRSHRGLRSPSATGRSPSSPRPLDATEAVLAENSFNEPPNGDDLFTMVRVAATYLGEDPTVRFRVHLRRRGRIGLTYGFEDDCGVAPDSLPGLSRSVPRGYGGRQPVLGGLRRRRGALVVTAEAAFSLRQRSVLPGDRPPRASSSIAPVVGRASSRRWRERFPHQSHHVSGQAALVGTWEITVLGSTPDATDAVLAENTFNDPPDRR